MGESTAAGGARARAMAESNLRAGEAREVEAEPVAAES